MVDCDVLIVGAGPVGVVTALLLVRRGIKVIIVEKEHGVIQSPRAVVYLPQVNGTLEEAGILQDVRNAGLLPEGGVAWRKQPNHELLGAVDPHALRPEDWPQAHHRRPVLLGQHLLAEIALEKLQRYGTQVHFACPFQSLAQGPDNILVTVMDGEGNRRDFTTRFVLGADGARSDVRKVIDASFEGFTHDINFMAVNLRYSKMLDTGFGDAQFLVDPQPNVEDSSFAIILRTGTDDIWRCAYGDGERFSEEELRARLPLKLKRILPLNPDEGEYEVIQAQPYRVHQRCAATYVKGRVLLVGDAAHVNNPVGGMGLNMGILDSQAAATAISDALKLSDETAVEKRLRVYSDVRKAAFLEFTNPVSIDNLRRLREVSDEADNKLRSEFFAALKNPDFQRGMQLAMNTMGQGVSGCGETV